MATEHNQTDTQGRIIRRDFFQAVGFGSVQFASRVTSLGHNASVSTSNVPQDIWAPGGTVNWLSSESVLEVLSASANDVTAGTGATKVIVVGLDGNYNQISETLNLNGVTPVSTVRKYLRVNTFMITGAGSGKTNAGAITLRVTGGGSTVALIEAGYGFSRSAVYTVPAGFVLQIHSEVFAVNKATASSAVTIANYIQDPTGFFRMPRELTATNNNPYRHDGLPGLILNPKTDFTYRATSSSVAGGVDVTAGFLGILWQITDE